MTQYKISLGALRLSPINKIALVLFGLILLVAIVPPLIEKLLLINLLVYTPGDPQIQVADTRYQNAYQSQWKVTL